MWKKIYFLTGAYLTYDLIFPEHIDKPLKVKKLMLIKDILFGPYYNDNLSIFELSNLDQATDGEFIFIITKDKKMFLSKPEKCVMNHRMLGYGKQVYAAGEIIFKDGAVLSWSQKSGHYRPYNRNSYVE